MKHTLFSRVLIFLILLCVLNASTAFSESGIQKDPETMLTFPFHGLTLASAPDYVSSLAPEGAVVHMGKDAQVTFETGDFRDSPVLNEQHAMEVVRTILRDRGSVGNVEPVFKRTTVHAGILCHTFLLSADGVKSENGVIKIITNREGRVLGTCYSPAEENPMVMEETSAAASLSFPHWNRITRDVDIVLPYSTSTFPADLEVNPDTGKICLIDSERQIFCVFMDPDALQDELDPSILQPVSMDDDHADSALMTFTLFQRTWGFFKARGWESGDGLGTPCLLVFDQTGSTNGNASFNGLFQNFILFQFGFDDEAGRSLSTIAHEFMHAVSSTHHIGRYMNETGALNEALSDLMGSTVSSAIQNTTIEQDEWIPLFYQAHANEWPLFRWDEYYRPPTREVTSENDMGGVHYNSTIISVLQLLLLEQGMSFDQLFDLWFIFDMTLTPATDFAETAAKLPWCAEIAGLKDYAPLLKEAVHRLRLSDPSLPRIVPDHQALVILDIPFLHSWESWDILLTFQRTDSEKQLTTWPVEDATWAAAVLEAGSYTVTLKYTAIPQIDDDPDETPQPQYCVFDGTEWTQVKEEELGEAPVVIYEGGRIYGHHPDS